MQGGVGGGCRKASPYPDHVREGGDTQISNSLRPEGPAHLRRKPFGGKTYQPISSLHLEHSRTRTLDQRRLARSAICSDRRNHEEQEGKTDYAGGIYDHIHLYASLPSTLSIADFVNAVKANSSRWVHQTYRQGRAFAWQVGYGAFSVSKSDEKRVIKYVLNQENHHRKRTFKEEFPLLLEKHEIEYDQRYVWD